MGTRLLHQRNCWSCKWELTSSNVQGLVPVKFIYQLCRLPIFNCFAADYDLGGFQAHSLCNNHTK